MTRVKISISLPEALLAHIDKLAREKKIPRSQVFVLALEHFVRDDQDRRLFEQINEAYRNEPPTPPEMIRLKQVRHQHRRIVASELLCGLTHEDQ